MSFLLKFSHFSPSKKARSLLFLFPGTRSGTQSFFWIQLCGKPKWLLLTFGYHSIMSTGPLEAQCEKFRHNVNYCGVSLKQFFQEGFYSALSWLSICIDLILLLWSETHSLVENSNIFSRANRCSKPAGQVELVQHQDSLNFSFITPSLKALKMGPF